MKNKRGGFTLVEVMTVVLLFGLLLLLIFPMRRMLFRVLERAEEQEHAEMVGDAVFRYVTDGLQTGSIRREDIENILWISSVRMICAGNFHRGCGWIPDILQGPCVRWRTDSL